MANRIKLAVLKLWRAYLGGVTEPLTEEEKYWDQVYKP